MFSIYYLEIISSTKLVSQKITSDATMGKNVNYIVCGFYISIFLLMAILQAVNNRNVNNDSTSIEVYYMKNWFYKQKPFSLPYKHSITIFDFS